MPTSIFNRPSLMPTRNTGTCSVTSRTSPPTRCYTALPLRPSLWCPTRPRGPTCCTNSSLCSTRSLCRVRSKTRWRSSWQIRIARGSLNARTSTLADHCVPVHTSAVPWLEAGRGSKHTGGCRSPLCPATSSGVARKQHSTRSKPIPAVCPYSMALSGAAARGRPRAIGERGRRDPPWPRCCH